MSVLGSATHIDRQAARARQPGSFAALSLQTLNQPGYVDFDDVPQDVEINLKIAVSKHVACAHDLAPGNVTVALPEGIGNV